MGLLTKIFGNPEGGASTPGEASVSERVPSSAASTEDPVISSYPKGSSSSSGIRPAVEAPQRPRESARPNSTNRRPEHPRMYLRPSPATLDPAVPGSTRRPQISVRPATKETARFAPPPPKRATLEPARIERPSRRGISVDLPYDLPSEQSSAPSSRPPSSPKSALVVSPVSLTPEEVQLPPGTRPKMPTLLGLGAALETPPLPLAAQAGATGRAAKKVGLQKGVADPRAHREANPTDAASLDVAPPTERAAFDLPLVEASAREVPAIEAARLEPATLDAAGLDSPVLEAPVLEAPVLEAPAREAAPVLEPARHAFKGLAVPGHLEIHDITAPVQLLADFALKLSLGPVSRSWVTDVRRSAHTLLSTAKQRHETALAALSERLLALLPNEPDTSGEAEETRLGAAPSPAIDGALRDQVLHEVSRLAGVLPEWPAPAQDLAEEARRREMRVLRELLSVVDGFKRDQRARLEGQMRLEELSNMAAEAIAEEFEAPLERARELRLVLDTYRRDRQTRPPDLGNALALSRALRELVRAIDAFDDCDPERKDSQRLLRLERRRALTSVNLLLAERGELDWLELLEPLSYGERVERLGQWLDAGSERAP